MMRARHISVAALFLCVAFASVGPARAEAAAPRVPEIKKDCSICHTLNDKGTIVKLKLPIGELCAECHTDRKPPIDHVTGVKPMMKVSLLPLDSDGDITCVTCHEPHGLTGLPNMLRAKPSNLCGICHKK